MAFSPRPPPCMKRMRKWFGTASSSRRSASARSQIEMNSLPRWLISITLMPLPCQSNISAATWCSTGSGRVAGPAEKLNGRDKLMERELLLRGRGCRRSRLGRRCRCRNAELLGQRGMQAFEAVLQRRAGFGDNLVQQRLVQLGLQLAELLADRRFKPGQDLLEFVLVEALVQEGCRGRRRHFGGLVPHVGDVVLDELLDVGIHRLGGGLALFGRHLLQRLAGGLHQLAERLLHHRAGQHFCSRLLQLDQLVDQRLLGRGGLGQCGASGEREGHRQGQAQLARNHVSPWELRGCRRPRQARRRCRDLGLRWRRFRRCAAGPTAWRRHPARSA
mmetsp:Transcript_36616/g.89025  ORF Transcript_36616/g.89025 Transcript_36616/m.89025 type:complete len:332 (+) Transcript_36616:107-1102(+)